MTDWTTCRVVRDRDGDLWFRGCDSDDLWTANTNCPDVFLTTDEVLTVFGPLAPVLNADGLPVWQPIEPGTVIKAGTVTRSELDERDALVAKVERVRALHQREVIAVHEFGPEAWCPTCELHYPCPTARALGGAES